MPAAWVELPQTNLDLHPFLCKSLNPKSYTNGQQRLCACEYTLSRSSFMADPMSTLTSLR